MSGAGTNFIATAIGMKRSGKSHLLAQLAALFPRRVLVDFMGEFAGLPNAIHADTIQSAVAALKSVQPKERWTVVLQLHPAEVIQIIEALCDQRRGYARSVGGLVIECGEADQLAPNSAKISPVVHSLFARGRHIGPVSALMAVRRPQEINRIATSQSDVVNVFRLHEPRDSAYVADIIGSDAIPFLLKLRKHEYIRYFPNYGLLQHVSREGHPTDLRVDGVWRTEPVPVPEQGPIPASD